MGNGTTQSDTRKIERGNRLNNTKLMSLADIITQISVQYIITTSTYNTMFVQLRSYKSQKTLAQISRAKLIKQGQYHSTLSESSQYQQI